MTQQKKSTVSKRKKNKKTLKNNRLSKSVATIKKVVAKKIPKPKVVVRKSPVHGRGVFAVTAIVKGARILEYTGERMTHAKADRLYGELHEGSSHTMLFAANDKVS